MMLNNLLTALTVCSSPEEMQDVLDVYQNTGEVRIFLIPGKYFGYDEDVFIVGENHVEGEKRPPETFACLLITSDSIFKIHGRSGLEYINGVTKRILRDIDDNEQKNLAS